LTRGHVCLSNLQVGITNTTQCKLVSQILEAKVT
jgi:hypothetical protein